MDHQSIRLLVPEVLSQASGAEVDPLGKHSPHQEFVLLKVVFRCGGPVVSDDAIDTRKSKQSNHLRRLIISRVMF